MEGITMRKVYVCCNRENDRIYKNQLVGMEEWDDSLSDWVSIFSGCLSFEGAEVGPAGESLGGAAESICENRMEGADVLILLCGENTKGDRLTDLEISAALHGDADHGRMGILVMNLPAIEGRQCRISVDGGSAYVEDCHGGRRLLGELTEKEIEDSLPFLPEEIIENLKKYICIPVVDWTDVCGDPARLRGLIDYENPNLQYYIFVPLRGLKRLLDGFRGA